MKATGTQRAGATRTDARGLLLVLGEGGAAVLLIWAVVAVTLAFLNAYWVSVVVMMLMWSYLCTAWNLIGGVVGQISFGHGVFFGIGAYATAFLSVTYGISPWIGMLAGMAISAAAAYLTGYIPFRLNLSHLVFALLTLALAFAAYYSVGGVRALGGTNGMFLPFSDSGLAAFRFNELWPFLVIMALFNTALLLLLQALLRGRQGYAWRAARDNEAAAAASGIDLFRAKQSGFIISAAATAVAGAFYAQFVSFIDPHSALGVHVIILILLFSVVGGTGTLLGPVIGTFVLFPLGEVLRVELMRFAAGSHQLVYGLALMAVILLWPGGIVGGVQRLLGGRWFPQLAVASPPEGAAATRLQPRSPVGRKGEVILRAEGIGRDFGGVVALKSVDLDVRQGEILGLIGPNGAGKTTLFSILAGSMAPSRGSVRFAGRRIDGLPPHECSRLGIARTFQIAQTFSSFTVSETVFTAALAGRSFDEARAAAAAALAQLSLVEHRDVPCSRLTLAEQRRLEIARAVATGPAVLLLDEVMAGLTPTEVADVIALVRTLRDSGITVVIIEHVMRAVMELCERIVVLDAGEEIASGPPAEISCDPRVIEAYLGSRARRSDAGASGGTTLGKVSL